MVCRDDTGGEPRTPHIPAGKGDMLRMAAGGGEPPMLDLAPGGSLTSRTAATGGDPDDASVDALGEKLNRGFDVLIAIERAFVVNTLSLCDVNTPSLLGLPGDTSRKLPDPPAKVNDLVAVGQLGGPVTSLEKSCNFRKSQASSPWLLQSSFRISCSRPRSILLANP